MTEHDFSQKFAALPAHTRYLVDHLPFGHKVRIADVGANPANVPDYAPLRDAGVVDVHGFEPGEIAYANLMKSARPNEFYHKQAVGRPRDAVFHATKNGAFASLYAPDEAQLAALGHWDNAMFVEAEVPVTTVALDDVPDLPKPDLLKMDTQGAELEILQSGKDLLSDAVAIVAELRLYRLYQGEPMVGEVDSYLRDQGFMLHKVLPGAVLRLGSTRSHRLRPAMSRNQMVDADYIYIRDIAQPDLMNSGQLARLALLADSTFGSIDLVLRCLDLLVARNAFDDVRIDEYVAALPRNFRTED